MAFAVFTGVPGVGKTLALTFKAWMLYKMGYVIFANYKLNFPHVFIESLEDLDEMHVPEGKKAAAFLDELWRWLDSREYKKDKNNLVSKIIFFSRKRGIQHVYFTTQRFHQIDKRIRGLTDAEIRPELSAYRKIPFQGRVQELPLKCAIEYYQVTPKENGAYMVSRKAVKTEKFFTLPIMMLYDTKEELQDLIA
jgi:hypothetical protein